jgi:hypothetical protein
MGSTFPNSFPLKLAGATDNTPGERLALIDKVDRRVRGSGCQPHPEEI